MTHIFDETADFTDDMSFGAFIRKKRRLMGMNQADFADMIGGFDQGTISMWELSVTSPPFESACNIVSLLGGTVIIRNLEDGNR